MNLPTIRCTRSKVAKPGAMEYVTNNCTNPTPCGSLDFAAPLPDGDPGYEAVDRLIAQAKEQALSANTRRTYRTGWRSWANWAQARGVPTLAAGPEYIQRWLAILWLEGKKPTTLGTYLSAVARELDNCPGPNPARHRDVPLVLSGLRSRAAGDIPQDHARLIARASSDGPIDEQALVEAAKEQGYDEFEKTLRRQQQDLSGDDGQPLLDRQKQKRTARMFNNRDTGMFILSGEFDPTTGQHIAAVVAEKERELWHQEDPKARRTPNSEWPTRWPS